MEQAPKVCFSEKLMVQNTFKEDMLPFSVMVCIWLCIVISGRKCQNPGTSVVPGEAGDGVAVGQGVG